MSALKIVLYIIGIVITLFLLFLLYFTVRDYNPDEKQIIESNRDASELQKDTFDILIWNIGYAGLGEDMSFFYDGGDRVRTTKERAKENLRGIVKEISAKRHSDFILIQEVDLSSKRSYHINQFRQINSHLNEFSGYFVLNYHVQFVPVPPTSPMGKVKSGLATFTRYSPQEVTRYDFPGKYAWPKSLFMLDRCFLVSRFHLKNDRDLLVINTHNSAYDNGKLKEQEMSYLKDYLLKEYGKGNYIITGGDWNQYPPGADTLPEIRKRFPVNQASVIGDDFMPSGWQWMFDQGTATNRSLDKLLNDGTQKSIIDFYLVSPNIIPLKVKTSELNFKYSDHQPVSLEFKLK
jgi:endonuclease/exonuclease/phosphatase family metal-dependent hydrolase